MQRLGPALALSALTALMLVVGVARSAPLDTLTIAAPADMSVTADQVCGQSNCARVFYAFSVSGGYPPYRLVCTPVDSGGLFLVGSRTVSCLAQDSEDDSTPYASFTLTVAAPSGGSEVTGGSGGSGSGGAGGGTGTGTGGSASGIPSDTSPASPTPAQTKTISLGGTPHVGHLLIVHLANVKPKLYVWQLERAGKWRRLPGQTSARLLVRKTYAGGRLRARVTLSSGRVLYSRPTAPVRR
jgi:hypothetical protein